MPAYQPSSNPYFARPQYAQYPGAPMPTQTPRYQVGLPGLSLQNSQGPQYNSGINDPTLAAGANGSYSYGGGAGGAGAGVPPGALPVNPFNNGNVNIMYSKGYRRKFINGNWYMVPPSAAGPQTPAYQPY